MAIISKAVIPAAGFGTRHLPITKAIAKEMLPILDRPAIDYVVEECVLSGITDICIVVSRGKSMIADYFDRVPEIESSLAKSGKTALLEKINAYMGKVHITYVRQPEMRGTAYAVDLCRDFAAGEPFALLFPDDVMYNPDKPVTRQGEPFALLFPDDVMYNPDKPVTRQLMEAYYEVNAPVIGVQDIPPEEAVKYGVMLPLERRGKLTLVGGYQEKPAVKDLVSTLTSLGRFVLTPEVFDFIKTVKPTHNGEYYLSTAFDDMAKVKPVYSYTFDGIRYDMGGREGFLKANIDYALRDPSLAPFARSLLKR